MAATHAERYRAMNNTTISGVVSPNTAEQFVQDHGLDAPAFTSIETFLDETSLDAVSICSPTWTHREIVETVAEYNIDILCEKPIASTLADANAIADVADEQSVTIMIGHTLRFFPDYRRVYDQIESEAVGTPGTVRARRHSPFPDWGHGWFAADEKSGGVFLDLGVHEFDYLRWLFGDVEYVFARRNRWGDRQNGHATLVFENGTVGYVEVGWDRIQGVELWSTLEIAGDDGLIEYDARKPTPLTVTAKQATGAESTATVAKDGYRHQLEAFVECIERGKEPLVTADDAIEAIRISIAANRSAEQNEPIPIAEVVV